MVCKGMHDTMFPVLHTKIQLLTACPVVLLFILIAAARVPNPGCELMATAYLGCTSQQVPQQSWQALVKYWFMANPCKNSLPNISNSLWAGASVGVTSYTSFQWDVIVVLCRCLVDYLIPHSFKKWWWICFHQNFIAENLFQNFIAENLFQGRQAIHCLVVSWAGWHSIVLPGNLWNDQKYLSQLFIPLPNKIWNLFPSQLL